MGLSRIGSNSITDASIATGDLANGAVSNTKLATGSVENYFGTQGLSIGKNRIINGAMVIDQRNAGSSITVNSGNSAPFCTDRWRATWTGGTATAFTLQQSSEAPNFAGFSKSLLATVTNNTSTTGYQELFYTIEGYNVADLQFGTANAKTFTLSFWVRSSVTGLYGVGFENEAGTYTYVGTYTVNSANTWEHKTITVPGPTSGTFVTTNGRGLTMRFDLGSASSLEQAAGSWVNTGSSRNRSSDCVKWIENSGATYYITGVQLEVGSIATQFEHRPYGTELALCQRYYFSPVKPEGATYQITFATSTGDNGWTVFQVPFPVTMRAVPTLTHNISDSNRVSAAPSGNQWAFYKQNQGYPGKQGNSNSSVFNGGSTLNHSQVGGYYFSPNDSASGIRLASGLTFEFSAEL